MLVLPLTRTIIESISEGPVIRTAVTTVLRLGALLNALFALYVLVELLKAAFKLETKGTIGGLLFAAVFIAGTFIVIQILLYRAGSVQELGDSPFTVIPIFSLLFRTFGETYAAWSIAFGLGGCLFIWTSGMSPLALTPGLGPLFLMLTMTAGSSQSFVDGAILLVVSVILSFLILVSFYFLAEIVLVAADIARNVRLLVQIAPATVRPSAATPPARPAAATSPPPPRPAPPRCPRCGVALTADDRFCGNCGAPTAAPIA